MKRLAALTILGTLPLVVSCSTIRTAGHVIDAVKFVRRAAVEEDEQTAVSFTLQNGPELVALVDGLRQFDVQADIEAVQQGVTVVRLVGAYVEIMNSINWLIVQGATALLANDEVSEGLLAIVVAFMKSGV